jgi:hypothetical protein
MWEPVRAGQIQVEQDQIRARRRISAAPEQVVQRAIAVFDHDQVGFALIVRERAPHQVLIARVVVDEQYARRAPDAVGR